jgi:hypothetical protein
MMEEALGSILDHNYFLLGDLAEVFDDFLRVLMVQNSLHFELLLNQKVVFKIQNKLFLFHKIKNDYFGKLLAIGVIVAELDFESISSIVSGNDPLFSSVGE